MLCTCHGIDVLIEALDSIPLCMYTNMASGHIHNLVGENWYHISIYLTNPAFKILLFVVFLDYRMAFVRNCPYRLTIYSVALCKLRFPA